MNDAIIEKAIGYVASLFSDNADGHGTDHAMRVYQNALYLLDFHPECDRMAVSLSALLHDVDDHKLFHTENNANARAFLKDQHLPDETIDLICAIINDVSFSKNRGKKPACMEGMIVQDADRLDAIGAIGIARTFAYGGRTGRPLDDSIKHFYDKLLLLEGEMNTKAAKELAASRHEYMKHFLDEFSSETVPCVKQMENGMVWAAKTFDELNASEIYEILKSRAEIFIREQGIHYVDPDDTDYDCLHVFGMENGRVQAYLRAYRTDEKSVKIGRVLSLSHGKGFGTALMKYAIREIPKKMICERFIMDAQKHAVPFYERLGFTVTSEEYLEENVVHVDMCLEL